MVLTHIVSPEEAGLTLHQLLRGPMALSGRQTRDVKARGAVTVDAAPFFSNQCVRAGMLVRVELAGYGSAAAPHSPCVPPDVVYEDDILIAVYKPAMLQCHPSPSAPAGSDTLERRVSAYLGRPAHPVHRLDSETTGIVLFAKAPYAQAHLQQQMQQGSFRKTYEAWALGVPIPAQGVIDAPIARAHPDSFTRIVSPDGQRAISRYRVMHVLPLGGGLHASLLSLAPLTGRTHQLRVHMAHIGCPLLGDTRYATAQSQTVSEALGLKGHQLAAVSLSFLHPVTGSPIALHRDAHFAFNPENARISP